MALINAKQHRTYVEPPYRNAKAAVARAYNLTLAPGTVYKENDTGRLKRHTGTTPYNDLPYTATAMLHGQTPPTAETGGPGDHYIDTVAGKLYAKLNGSTWMLLMDMKPSSAPLAKTVEDAMPLLALGVLRTITVAVPGAAKGMTVVVTPDDEGLLDALSLLTAVISGPDTVKIKVRVVASLVAGVPGLTISGLSAATRKFYVRVIQ